MLRFSGKKGYIFTLDLFIAVIIIFAGSFIILFNLYNSGQTIQPKVFSDDVLREAYTKQIFQLDYSVLTGTLGKTNPHGIVDPTKTIAEQSAEFYYLAKTTNDPGWNDSNSELLKGTLAPLIPPQYSYTISINGQTIISRPTLPYSESYISVPSKIIVSGLDRNGDFYGPYLFEVLIWQ